MAVNTIKQQSYSAPAPWVSGSKTPKVIPVPTPNPLAVPGTGMGAPTSKAYNRQGQVMGTSWDTARYSHNPQAAKSNLNAIRNANYNKATEAQRSSNTPVQGSGGGGGQDSGSQPPAREKITITRPDGTKITTYRDASAQENIEAVKSALPGTDYGAYADLMNPEQFFSEIERTYQGQQGFLNQAEQTAGQEKQSALDLAQKEFGAAQGRLGQSRTQQETTVAQNTTAAEQRKADALAQARRLYNELLMGTRQRFGGASSAGEAAQTILGNEQQRQMGTTNREFQNVMSQIDAQKVDIEQNYQNSLAELEAQMQRARNDILSSFNQRIQAINQSRTTSEENKANARLAVLQNLRNQAFQIQQQQDLFKQQIEAMKIQQQMNLDAYAKQLATGGQKITSAYDRLLQNSQVSGLPISFNTPSTNVLNQQSNISQAIGMINPQSRAFNIDEYMRNNPAY